MTPCPGECHPGGIIAAAADVVGYDGFVYSIEFDASDESVPAGVQVDAVTVGGGDLALPFDVTVSLGGNTYQDEDLVGFDGLALAAAVAGNRCRGSCGSHRERARAPRPSTPPT